MDSRKIKLGFALFAEKDNGDKEVIRVENLGLNGVNYDSSGRKFAYSFDKLTGIPITDEALSAIGFDYNAQLGLWAHSMIGLVRLVKASGLWFAYYTRDKTTSIKYIHDVQNIYSALTGNELEVDADTLNLLYDDPVVLATPKGFKVKARSMTEVTIEWGAVPGASSYVYIFDDGEETSFEGEVTELTFDELEVESEHTLSVKAIGDGTEFADSLFSRRYKFTTDPLPALETPVLTVTPDETSIKAEWETVDNAVKYQYKVDDGTWTDVSETEVNIIDLEPDTDYIVYVKAIGDGEEYNDSIPAEKLVRTLETEPGPVS